MDTKTRPVYMQETQALNDTLNKKDLIDIYRTFHPKPAEYTLFSSAHGTFSRIDNMLDNKICLNTFKRIVIISNIYSNHNSVELEIIHRKKNGKSTTHGV